MQLYKQVLYFLRKSFGRVKIFCRLLLLILAFQVARCNRIRYAATSTSI